MTPNRKRDPTHVVAVKYKTTTVPEGVVEPGDAYVTVEQWQWHSLLNRKYFFGSHRSIVQELGIFVVPPVNPIGTARRQALDLSGRVVKQNSVEERTLPHAVGMFTCTFKDHTSAYAIAPEGRCLETPHSTNEEVILPEKKHVIHPVAVTTPFFRARVRLVVPASGATNGCALSLTYRCFGLRLAVAPP